jgi:hypothetical protein
MSSSVYSAAIPPGMEPTSPWSPLPALARSDADVTLMVLEQNTLIYKTPSDDPWMPAHISDPDIIPRFWMGDYDLNLMGCIEQYQICNPNLDRDTGCTKLSGSTILMASFIEPEARIGLTRNQMATVDRFLVTSSYNTMNTAVSGRGAAALNG